MTTDATTTATERPTCPIWGLVEPSEPCPVCHDGSTGDAGGPGEYARAA